MRNRNQFVFACLLLLIETAATAGFGPTTQQLNNTTQQTSAPPPPAPTPGKFAALRAAEVLQQANLLCLRKRSSWFNRDKLEGALLKRKEFAELGLEITRDEKSAELVLEVTRKVFTTRFTCNIIEPSSQRVLASTTSTSLGGEIETHLAEGIIKIFKAARQARTGNGPGSP